jgi:hypothetical protein
MEDRMGAHMPRLWVIPTEADQLSVGHTCMSLGSWFVNSSHMDRLHRSATVVEVRHLQ